jgi:hypothetical protein
MILCASADPETRCEMVKDYSLDALNRFLDYALEKGLLKPETAKSRKTAVNKILEKIPSEQRDDVRKVDLDLEAEHFANRQGAGYIPSSLQTYKSRAKTALADFEAYVDNPMTFRPAGASNGKAQSKTSSGQAQRKSQQKSKQEKLTAETDESDSGGRSSDGRQAPEGLTFPVPIRPGLIVQLKGVPFDLTTAEAEKIAQVVKALASNQ